MRDESSTAWKLKHILASFTPEFQLYISAGKQGILHRGTKVAEHFIIDLVT